MDDAPSGRSEVEQEVSARTRRLVGAAMILLFLAGGIALKLSPCGTGGDADIRRGVAALLAAVEGRRDGFEEARAAFGEALRRRPFDSFSPFLLRLTERLERAAPLPPHPTLLERGVALVASGELEAARGLLKERPIDLRTDGERYLLRFLSEAAGLR